MSIIILLHQSCGRGSEGGGGVIGYCLYCKSKGVKCTLYMTKYECGTRELRPEHGPHSIKQSETCYEATKESKATDEPENS